MFDSIGSTLLKLGVGAMAAVGLLLLYNEVTDYEYYGDNDADDEDDDEKEEEEEDEPEEEEDEEEEGSLTETTLHIQ